jgi:hypothetical protein
MYPSLEKWEKILPIMSDEDRAEFDRLTSLKTVAETEAPVPFDKQKEVIESKAKRKIVKAGRRSGKTVGAGIIGVNAFEDGLRVLYAAPTQEQIERFWVTVKRSLQPKIDADEYYKNESKHIIEKTGTEQRIKAKTAWNADTLRGDYADLLILDEWQLMDEDAWELVGAPMLLDNNGDAIFIFTPPSYRTRSVSKARDPQHAIKMYRKAKEDKSGRWKTFHWTSHDNPTISEEALDEITEDMSGIAYRQEILAEDIDEVPGALWTRTMIEETRVKEYPELTRIVIPIDPQGKVREFSETGIVPCGLGTNGHGYILSDDSLNALPKVWGARAIKAYEVWEADRIVAEVNFGGDMVEAVIKSIDEDVPVKQVRASRGKMIRAEPVSALWEKGKIHIVGHLPILEDEMCGYTPESRISPNRLDSMVWGITELMLGKKRGAPRMKASSSRDAQEPEGFMDKYR